MMNMPARKMSSDILNHIDWPEIRARFVQYHQQTREAAQYAAAHQTEPVAPVPGDQPEKRRHPRKPIRIGLHLTNGRVHGQMISRDISLGGIFVETTAELAVGQHLRLSIPFANQDRSIIIEGTVARVTREGVGVQFDPRVIDIE